MSELSNTIVLRMGDWSDDGHGKTETVTIRSNLNLEEIKDAYTAGVGIIGFDCIKDLCSEYEDRDLDETHAKLLSRSGFDLKENIERYHGQYTFWTNSYPSVFLFFVKKGNPIFEYEEIQNSESIIEIGGYGLFS